MSALAIISLIVTILKAVSEVMAWLDAHPEVTGRAKEALTLAKASVSATEAHVGSLAEILEQRKRDVQGP